MSSATPTSSAPFELFYFGGLLSPEAPLIASVVFGALVVPLVVWFWQRRNVEPIRSRSPQLVILPLFYLVVALVIESLSYYYRFTSTDPWVLSVACHLNEWVGVGTMIFGFLPYVVRGLRLYVQYTKGRLMMADNRVAIGLPANMRFMELQRLGVRLTRWVITPWGGLTALVLSYIPFLIATGVLYGMPDDNPSDPNPLWCNTSRGFTWVLVAEIIYMHIIASPVVIMVWFADDALFIRYELTTIYLCGSPSSILHVALSNFKRLPYASVITTMAMSYISLFTSVVFPIALSYSLQRILYKQLRLGRSLISGSKHTGSGSHRENESESGISTTERDDHDESRRGSHGSAIRAHDDSEDRGADVALKQLSNTPANSSSDNLAVDPAKQPGNGQDGKTAVTGKSSSLQQRGNNSNGGHGRSRTKERQHTLEGPNLSALLKDPVESERLQVLAVRCFCLESVLFCLDVAKFKQSVESGLAATGYDPAAMKTAAESWLNTINNIMSIYIVPLSPREINITQEARESVQDAYNKLRASEVGSGRPDEILKAYTGVFAKAEKEITHLLRTNLMPLWRPAASTATVMSVRPVPSNGSGSSLNATGTGASNLSLATPQPFIDV